MSEVEHREVALGYAVSVEDEVRRTAGDRYFERVFAWPCIEPVKRNKDGLRWIRHRFPIKGGITQFDAMSRDLIEIVFSPSPLFAAFKERTP